MNLTKNVGLVDQVVRALVALDLITPCVLGFVPGLIAFLMVAAAIVLVVTCITGHCWLYDSLHLSTWEATGF